MMGARPEVEAGNKYASALTGMGKVVDRLRKILELTKSPNEAEAASAARKLQDLLTEHNLSVADLESRGQKAPGVREQPHDLGKAAFGWKLDLAEGIAEFYYCAPLVNRKGREKSVAFVGRPDNVEALQMLYGWIIEQVKAIAATARRGHYDTTGEHIDPLRWQVSFGEGIVHRLIDRLKELKARQEEGIARNEQGDAVGLAVHHATEASDYLEVKYGYREDGKRTKKEQEAYERYVAKEERRVLLKAQCEANGDMEPYYKECPWERPDTPEDIAWREKRAAERDKREARNARRRTGGGHRERRVDERKEEQQYTARSAGRESAGKVNLQPFIGGNQERKKVG